MWSIRVSNLSPLAATGVTLKVTLPDFMYNGDPYSTNVVYSSYFIPVYTSPNRSYLTAGTIATYSLDTLTPGASRSFQIALKPGYALANGRIFTMNARADSNNGVPSSETQATVPYAATISYPPTITTIPDQITNEDTPLTINNIGVADLDTAGHQCCPGHAMVSKFLLCGHSVFHE